MFILTMKNYHLLKVGDIIHFKANQDINWGTWSNKHLLITSIKDSDVDYELFVISLSNCGTWYGSRYHIENSTIVVLPL